MNKIFAFCLLILGSFSSAVAAVAAEDSSPQELTRRYMSVLGRTEGIPQITTPKEGFDYIVQSITRLSGKPHTHVESGPQYGFSFVHKNIPPVEFVAELMTGKKSWKKTDIVSNPISIADIGCGLGFSAAYFVSEAVGVYSSEPEWVFQSPIRLDLYDITPEHQHALRPLAALVNAAYPQYFHLETFTHDAKDSFPENQYRVVFALNLLHYVPEHDCPQVISNIERTLERGGMLFITTDHYHTGTRFAEQGRRLEAAAKKRAEDPSLSPFVFPLIPLMNPQFGDQFQTKTLNTSFEPFLTDPTRYVPGVQVRIEDINFEAVGRILRRHAQEQQKSTAIIGLYDGERLSETPVAEVIARLRDGRLVIQLAALGFDENLLEKAIINSSKGTLTRLKISSWPQKLPISQDGYPSSVGLTFTKK